MVRNNEKLESDFQEVARDIDPVRLYLNEIGSIPLLTREEEISLSRRIQAGIRVTEAYKKKLKDSIITPEIQSETEKQYQGETAASNKIEKHLDLYLEKQIKAHLQSTRSLNGNGQDLNTILDGEVARQELTSANLRLVVSIAKNYRYRGLGFMDLIQDGNSGLMMAAARYTPEKEEYRTSGEDGQAIKFSTYATWWIKQAIRAGIANQARTIRTPIHVIEGVSKIRGAIRRMTQDLGREPAIKEVAQELEMHEQDVREIMDTEKMLVNLDDPVGDGDAAKKDLIEDETTEPVHTGALRTELRDCVHAELAFLPIDEKEVLERRFGISGHDGPQKLREIADAMGLTVEKVRQKASTGQRRLSDRLIKHTDIEESSPANDARPGF